jgi:hypothetical protein
MVLPGHYVMCEGVRGVRGNCELVGWHCKCDGRAWHVLLALHTHNQVHPHYMGKRLL